MASNYPTSIDNFSNPAPTDKVNNAVAALVHSTQHSQLNDAVEALEAKVGANSSAVTTSHDYKLSGVTGSDKAVSLTGTEALTNKTLTNSTIDSATNTVTADYLRSASGKVDVKSATAPTNGQFLVATSGTTATWQTIPVGVLVPAIGLTTRVGTAASGTETIAHGLGTTPSMLRFDVATCSKPSADWIATSRGLYKVSSTTTKCIYWTSQVGSYDFDGNSSTYVIAIYNANGSGDGQVASVSVDATNITLTWTKIGVGYPNGTLQVLWEANN